MTNEMWSGTDYFMLWMFLLLMGAVLGYLYGHVTETSPLGEAICEETRGQEFDNYNSIENVVYCKEPKPIVEEEYDGLLIVTK